MVKVGSQGQIWTEHRRWEISYALAGQWVELVRLDDRVLVYHCRTVSGSSISPASAPRPWRAGWRIEFPLNL